MYINWDCCVDASVYVSFRENMYVQGGDHLTECKFIYYSQGYTITHGVMDLARSLVRTKVWQIYWIVWSYSSMITDWSITDWSITDWSLLLKLIDFVFNRGRFSVKPFPPWTSTSLCSNVQSTPLDVLADAVRAAVAAPIYWQARWSLCGPEVVTCVPGNWIF